MANLSEMLHDRLLGYLTKKSVESANERGTAIGLSQAGHCVRQLGYKRSGLAAGAWGWRMYGSLHDGHDTHEKVRKWLKGALKGTHFRLTGEEKEVSYRVLNTYFLGHIDGLITKICLSEKCKEHESYPPETLLEIKSCKDFEYKDAITGKVKREYIAQHQAYMMAMNLKHGLMLYREKASGKFAWVETTANIEEMKLVDTRLTTLVQSTDVGDLPREYGPNSYGTLPFECGYCPYVMTCWKEHSPRLVKEDPRIVKVTLPEIRQVEMVGEL